MTEGFVEAMNEGEVGEQPDLGGTLYSEHIGHLDVTGMNPV